MFYRPSAQELMNRIQSLQEKIREQQPSLDTVLIFGRISQYYLTGTYQDAIFVIRRDAEPILFVRKSYTRASLECPLNIVKQIRSFRDLLNYLPDDLGAVGMDTQQVIYAKIAGLQKYFSISSVQSIDQLILQVRSVKSESELSIIKEAGKRQGVLMTQIIPALLYEGMSEAQLMADIYTEMVRMGHHGVSRFSMHQVDFSVGQIGFGENTLYATFFDGPGGMRGLSPAVPVTGSQERRLQKGDLVYADIAFGIDGYHTDKTQVYSFGSTPAPVVQDVHTACRLVLEQTAALLKPGAVPSEIYQQVLDKLPAVLSDHFMGYYDDPVRFLGHGVGLNVDETPVIARGFSEPIEAGMVIAIEPKCGVTGHGMTGVEETYLILPDGVRCLTGGDCDIIVVSSQD